MIFTLQNPTHSYGHLCLLPSYARPLHVANLSAVLVESINTRGAPAATQQMLDNRPRAWLAAALMAILGAQEAFSMESVAAAVDQLHVICAQAASAAAWDATATIATSTPQHSSGSIGSSIAFRRWRVGSSWSRGSGGGASYGGLAPWRGAVSGHNSSDAEQYQSASRSDVLALL